MKIGLTLTLLCFVFMPSLSGQTVDATVCDILANPYSFDGKIVRIKGTAIAGLDEFVIKGFGCNQPVNAIWLAYPEGTKGKAGAAAFVQLQLSRNNSAPVTAPSRANIRLDKNRDFKQFDSMLSTPYKSGGMCLGCIRYTVSATFIGRLDGTKSTGVIRDKAGKFTRVDGFGNLNRYSARLVLQSVSEASPQEIDYLKNAAAARNDTQNEGSGGDPIAAAHQAARAFGSGNASGEQVERAAAAFGKQGEDNGVEVGFGASNEVPKNDGPNGQQDSPDGLLFNCTFDMDRLKGDSLSKGIVHVGMHVADIRDAQVASDTTLYKLEAGAWRTTVLSAVASGQKTLTLPGGYLGWNSAWATSDRGKLVEDSISKFLTEWSSLSDPVK